MKIETKDILLLGALGAAAFFGWQYFKSKDTAEQLADPRFQQWLKSNPAPNPQQNPNGWKAWLDRALALAQILFPGGIKIGGNSNQFGNFLLGNPQLDSSGFGFGLNPSGNTPYNPQQVNPWANIFKNIPFGASANGGVYAGNQPGPVQVFTNNNPFPGNIIY